MRTALLMLCLFSAALAFGQATAGASAFSSQPVVLQFPSHPEHASQTPLAQRESLLENATLIYERGEKSLRDIPLIASTLSFYNVGAALPEVPLGDVARAVRKRRDAAAKKAEDHATN